MSVRVCCLILATLAFGGADGFEGVDEIGGGDCGPTFREASAEPIAGDLALWSVSFRVALIGCRDAVTSLTNEELDRIRGFLATEPVQWANVFLHEERLKPGFRQRVAAGVNEIVGRDSIDDVLFYDIVMYDVSRTGTGR